MIKIKIHEAYRKICAICDADLIGKKFQEGNLQLDVKESFYDGEMVNEAQAIEIMRSARVDDATFNIVGKEAVNIALKAGIINKQGLIKIQGIPHALGLI